MATYVLIIDDEQSSLDDSRRVVEGLKRADLVVHGVTSVAEALGFLNGHPEVSLVLCDVEMPVTDGLDAVGLLRDKCRRFVYLTGHPGYLDRANDTDADAFLLKPLREKHLLRQLDKLNQTIQMELGDDTLRFINDGAKRRLYAISLADIRYVSGAKDYIELVLPNETKLIYHTLKGFMAQRGIAARFIRISKSIVVPKDGIAEVGEKLVHLQHGHHFPIGPRYLEETNRFWQERLLGKRYPYEGG